MVRDDDEVARREAVAHPAARAREHDDATTHSGCESRRYFLELDELEDELELLLDGRLLVLDVLVVAGRLGAV